MATGTQSRGPHTNTYHHKYEGKGFYLQLKHCKVFDSGVAATDRTLENMKYITMNVSQGWQTCSLFA